MQVISNLVAILCLHLSLRIPGWCCHEWVAAFQMQQQDSYTEGNKTGVFTQVCNEY
jgi:hypothetical protein